MTYSMGIDAGGTYTDAVILDYSNRKILAFNKVLTTYPDTLKGIENVINGIDLHLLEKVKFVSVSTTLATNTILENTGYPVALILVGDYSIPSKTPIERYLMVKGGHNAIGAEIAPLDMNSVKDFVQKIKNEVSAFAISSYFSMRNPEHELEIKNYIVQETNLPVVCGHELSQELGAYERGVTAYLNAQLIPIANQFTNSIVHEMKKRAIDAKIMMLKCDGSLINIKEAIEKPIESIFTGPAASLMGASFLSKKNTCLVIDVGGTSTDVSLIKDGLPELCEEGAKVGDWHTKVKAIRIETSAMGGDSHVWVKNRNTYIGPRRVMPLCLAAAKYPEFKKMLKMAHVPARLLMAENVQPTKFFIRTGKEPQNLHVEEKRLFDAIKDKPSSLSDIFWELENSISIDHLNKLIEKRLIQAIGFTPTDALHILDEYNEWDKEASFIGATILSRYLDIDEYEFARSIKKQVSFNMVLNLMAYILPDVNKREIEKILKMESISKFKLSIPVVLLGGPVRSYVEDIEKIIDAEIILPEHYAVGNAIGALIGQTVKKIEILIRSTTRKNRRKIFFVFTSKGSEEFETHIEAVKYAEQIGVELIMDYMGEYGVDLDKVKINISKENITLYEGSKVPIETKIVFIGTGNT